MKTPKSILSIQQILDNSATWINQTITIKGWIQFSRAGKNLGFIELSDGLTWKNIQLVYSLAKNKEDFSEWSKLLVGAAIIVTGKVVERKSEKNHGLEIATETIQLISNVNSSYPLQPKFHTLEFLRTHSELRARTRYFSAIFRLRNVLFFAIHEYLQSENFQWLSAPILTANDCEGGGESFAIEQKKDFLETQTLLTVSGQLHAEAMAQAMKKVYTFGPTFRADKSNTRFHASEFWMLEPEIAFATKTEIFQMISKMFQFIEKKIEQKCGTEIAYLVEKNKFNYQERMKMLSQKVIPEISYTEAVEILKKAEFKINWGENLPKDGEIYLCEHFKSPIFVIDYPIAVKAFYMKLNNDKKTVKGFDLLIPEIGELLGGSEREPCMEKIKKMAHLKKISLKNINWYIDLRNKGYAGSAGFGLGFDRLLMYLTGTKNVRDVIPFFFGIKSPKW